MNTNFRSLLLVTLCFSVGNSVHVMLLNIPRWMCFLQTNSKWVVFHLLLLFLLSVLSRAADRRAFHGLCVICLWSVSLSHSSRWAALLQTARLHKLNKQSPMALPWFCTCTMVIPWYRSGSSRILFYFTFSHKTVQKTHEEHHLCGSEMFVHFSCSVWGGSRDWFPWISADMRAVY